MNDMFFSLLLQNPHKGHCVILTAVFSVRSGMKSLVFLKLGVKVLTKKDKDRPVTEQGIWRIRTDEELWELHRTAELVADIKRRRLEWFEDAENDLLELKVKRSRQKANN
jgi:hypothetical protein